MQGNQFAKQTRFPSELFAVALLVVIVWGLWAAQAFFVPLFLAGLLAFMAAPLMRLLRRFRVPEWLAITVAAALFILPIAFVVYMLLNQAQSILSDYPSIVASFQNWIHQVSTSSWGSKFELEKHLTIPRVAQHVGAGAGEGMRTLVHALKAVFEASTEFVLIFIFAIIMLASREHLYLSGEKILARFESIEAARLLEAVTTLIEKFLLTKLIVIAIISLLTFFALQFLGLKYAFLLGIVTGVLTLLPEVGFVLSLVPVFVVALATGHSWLSVGLIMGSMVAVHLVEANFFTPKLVGKKLNLNVLATFVGLFAGGLMCGVWGMLLSVPVLGIMRIAFSVTPSLQPWAFLLSEKEDRQLGLTLMSRTLRTERLKFLLNEARRTIAAVPRREQTPG